MISSENEAETLAQLIAQEPIFHRFEHLQGRAPMRADFEALAAPDFFEIGASGRLYTRDFVLQTLEERHRNPTAEPDRWRTRDFRLLPVCPGTWIVSYMLEQELSSGLRTTRRSTLWRHTPEGWQIRFHQGTPA